MNRRKEQNKVGSIFKRSDQGFHHFKKINIFENNKVINFCRTQYKILIFQTQQNISVSEYLEIEELTG